MRGIFVLGDVRLHWIHSNQELTEEPSPNTSEFGTSTRMLDGYIAGGAYMVTDLVQLALFDLPHVEVSEKDESTSTDSNNEIPILLAYPEPQTNRPEVQLWWDYAWIFAPSENPRLGKTRTVLYEPKRREDTDVPNSWLPPLISHSSGQFWNRPIPNDYDKKNIEQSAVQLNKIDLLVIDDLNKSFRNATAVERQTPTGTVPSSHGELVHNILDRFATRCEEDAKTKKTKTPLLQPMVIVILKSVPMVEVGDGPSYWKRLVGDEELSKRTVAILDADYLRRDGVYISESLSWELTARNFIEALQKKDRFRDLRRVGHLVVRFGVTGVLYACRDQLEWSYKLYFSPEHDDREYTTDKDGVIIGYGAVLAAAVVRSLWLRCSQDSKQPNVNALPEVMEDGLLHGLRACNYLCAVGYGQNPGADAPFSRTEKLIDFTEQRGNWIAGFPRDLFLRTMAFDEQLRWRAVKGDSSYFRIKSNDTDVKIVVTLVPAPPAPLRSFLSHSCRQVDDTAFDIAQYGVDKIINLPCWSAHRIKNALHACFISGRFFRAWTPFLPRFDSPTNAFSEEAIQPKWKFCSVGLLDLIANEVVKLQPFAGRPIRDKSQIKKCCRDFLTEQTLDGWIEYFIPTLANQIRANDLATNKRKQRKLESLISDASGPVKSSDSKNKLDTILEPLVKHLTNKFAELFLPIHAPIAKYGSPKKGGGLEEPHLIVVDRREVEGYRTLANLIQGHLEKISLSRQNRHNKVERPLSVALFGPPGSGKSFAIKQIVAAVKPDLETCTININLGEFNSPQQLAGEFQKINQEIAQHKVPIVFFDEFDSSNGKEPLAWLKSFLAPMEDGRYQGATVNESIFVFAGGTCSTFAEFGRHSWTRTDPHWLEFATAKGPD